MKRWKYLVLALIGVLLFSFAACAEGDTEEEKTPSVTLSASSAALDLYETIWLTARAENTDEPVVWSSSDPSRATVEDGLVTALAVGNNVRITASAGGASAVCVVTITDSQAAPVLSVSESSVRLAEGESFTVTASVQLKGEPVQNVSYRWAGGDAFASVQAEGAQAVIFGLSEGETEIYVSATVRGIYVAQRIFVAVRSLDIVFDLANCKPGDSGTYAAQLYTLDAEGYEASFTPALTVYENGIAVPDPQLQWESKNSAVVRVENNETLAAVSAGSTQVVCRYKQESIAIDVTVSRTRLPLSGSAVAELHVLKPITIEGEISGEVTDATFKGVSVFGSFNAATNELTLSAEKFPRDAAHLGEGELILTTQQADYVLSAALYTMVIHDSGELDQMYRYGIGEGVNGYVCDGYFILGDDIEYTGTSFLPLAPEGVVGLGGNEAISGITGGFRGVFDGKGHTVTGLKFDLSASSRAYNGMFGVLHREGIVQNVAFEDATICGALIAYRGSGTVRNVYASFASITGGTNGHYTGFVYTGGAAAGARVEAVFLDASDPSAYHGANTSNTRLIGCGVSGEAVYGGVYLISPAVWRDDSVSGAGEADVYAAFGDYAAFAADAAAQSVFAEWDKNIWTADANGCPVFR